MVTRKAAVLSTIGLVLCLFVNLGFTKAQELEPLTIRDFSAGLNTKQDPAIIPNNASQDLENVDVWSGSIVKRRGSVKQNSSNVCSSTFPVRLVHEFPDSAGAAWLLSVTGSTICKSNDGGVTNSVLTSSHGFTSSSRVCAFNAYGKAYLGDGTTNYISFDGSAVLPQTAIKKGRQCEFAFDRGFTADLSGDRSTLYASARGDLDDWTDDETGDDDAFSEPIRKNDGYPITCIRRVKSGLLIFKSFSMDFLTLASDGLTLINNPVSNTIGTQHCNTVRETENGVNWLGADSFYSWNGGTIRRLSDIIDPTVDQIKQLTSNTRSYSQTSQTDFQTGTQDQTSPNIIAGSVLLSTWTDTDTTGAEFNAGTLNSVSTTVVSGAVYLSTNNVNITNNSFESNGSGWTTVSGTLIYGGTQCSGSAQDGSKVASLRYSSSNSISARILNSSNDVLVTTSFTPTSSFAQGSIPTASVVGAPIKISFANDFSEIRYTDAFIASGSTITFYYRSCTSPDKYTEVDFIENGRSTISSGTYTSVVFDTAITSPTWANNSIGDFGNGGGISLETRVSSDSACCFDSYTTSGLDAAVLSANKRYLQYRVTLTTSSNSSALPFFTDITFAAKSLRGRYLSPVINIGSNITSWGGFSGNASTVSNGTQVWELYTDTDTASGITVGNAATFTSSQTITHGSIPTISTAVAAYVASTFTVTNVDGSAQIDDFTLEWNEGDFNFPVWSIYHEGDYITAVAITSTTGNDKMLVYDRNGAWTLYNDLPAYSLGFYRQNPHFGHSGQSSIVRFQADGVYNDYSGSPVGSYWVSKEFDFGYPNTDKTIVRYYTTAKYRAGDDAVFEYAVNRSTQTTSETLDLDSNTGFFRKVIIPSSLTYKRGISHRIKISDSDSNDRFDILSLTIKANLETEP